MRFVLVFFGLLSGCSLHRTNPIGSVYESAERLLKHGDFKRALALADDGLQRCGSSVEWCWNFRLLKAEALLGRGQPKEALVLLGASDNPPNQQLQARRLMHEGQAWFRLSSFSSAEKTLGEARDLAAASHSPLLLAEVELRQGALFLKTNRYDDAEATLRRVLEAAIRGGDAHLEASAMGNLGVLFMDTFRFDEAIYWLQRVHALFARLGETAAVSKTIGNLAWCYYRLGEAEKALADFDQAVAGLARVGDLRGEQIWLGDSGNIFLDAENFPAAIERFTRALSLARASADKSSTAKWLNNLALASIGTGKLDSAERYNDESFAINEDLGDTGQQLYNQLNTAYIAAGRKQLERAEELFLSLTSSADPTPALQAREGLVDLYLQAADTQKADAQFRSAIASIEGRQAGLTKEDYKLSYLSSLVRFYQRYVAFLVERGEFAKGLEVVESSRARLLMERAKSRIAMARGWRASDLEALARASSRVFLSYWLAPNESYVWAITPAKIEIFKLPPEKEIRALVESYRTAIEDLRDPIDSHYPAGEKLSQLLLGPIRELVPEGSRVTLVPDGALHSLNFETLPALSNPSKYWIEDITLSIAPSLGLLMNSRGARRPARASSLLAIGDPEPPGQEYPRLPNARKEVDAIAALFSSPGKVVYEGQASHPSAYRQAGPARFSLIHFAAHATANRASPLDSALILSREGNAYTLTARDIMSVPLDAELVTLSSCRSAGARAYSGEGLVGLTWAFLQAGARRVIAGLWDVNDESTSSLMEQLYRGLARGVAPEDALRKAKLDLLHGGYPYRKPYYWGPFQVYSGM